MGKKLTLLDFIDRASIIHNNKYDYSQVIYINDATKIIIICNIDNHGIFAQTPRHHLNGEGCPKCKNIKLKIIHLSDTASFIKKAILVHGDKYNYECVVYTDAINKVIIKCQHHGLFEQRPNDHLAGKGCSKCGAERNSLSQRLTTDEFIDKANIIHNNEYNYDAVIYVNSHNKIIINCKYHGNFNQAPNNHLNGRGCPKCNRATSQPEIEWLKFLNIPEEYYQHRIIINNKLIKPDAYDPITKTIYEFYGSFWHGDPRIYDLDKINKCSKTTFRELYEKTIEREKMLISSGYKLIVIWELDWNKLKKTS